MDGHEKFCVFCCRPFSLPPHESPPGPPSSEGETGQSNDPANLLKKIYRDLLEIPLGFNSTSKSKRDESRKEIVNSLDYFDNVSVCLECLPFITAAKDFKAKGIKVGSRVLNLQRELLRELKILQVFTNDFYMEMKKIEEVILDSSLISLQNYLVENGPTNGHSRRGKAKGVVKLRDKFLDVIQQLELYQQQMFPKIDCMDAAKDLVQSKQFSNRNRAQVKTEPVCNDDVWDNDDFDKVEIEPIPYETGEVADVIPKIEKRENERFEEMDVEDDEYLEAYIDDLSPEDEESDEELSKKRKAEIERRKRREYKKRARAKKKALKEAKKRMGFKLRIVTRLRQEPLKKTSKNTDPVPEYPENELLMKDPRKNYTFDLDAKRDVFTCGGIDVYINESEEFLECSRCGHRASQSQVGTGKRPVEKLMAAHILGKHLGAFQCHVCPSQFQNYSTYNHHLRSHLDEFNCDVCGKPMSTRSALKVHKWSHMNEAEVAAAIASGQNDPRQRIARAKANAVISNRNSCRFCAKSFPSQTALRFHEDTHLPPEERERMICTICGKSLTRSGWESHRRYSCIATESNPQVQCPVCNNSYKSKPLLKRHMARNHTAEPGSAEERPFQCSTCAKTFKSRGDLKRHEVSHSDLRPFPCTMCGTSFKWKKHLQRHEKVCTGTLNPKTKKIQMEYKEESE